MLHTDGTSVPVTPVQYFYAQYNPYQIDYYTVRTVLKQAEAPFQHCPDHIIVNLVGIVFV